MVSNQRLHVVGKTNARNHLQSLSWGQGFISQTIDCQYSRDPSPGSWLGDAISDLHQAHPDARMIPLKVR